LGSPESEDGMGYGEAYTSCAARVKTEIGILVDHGRNWGLCQSFWRQGARRLSGQGWNSPSLPVVSFPVD